MSDHITVKIYGKGDDCYVLCKPIQSVGETTAPTLQEVEEAIAPNVCCFARYTDPDTGDEYVYYVDGAGEAICIKEPGVAGVAVTKKITSTNGSVVVTETTLADGTINCDLSVTHPAIAAAVICAAVAANCNTQLVINEDGDLVFTDNAGADNTIPLPASKKITSVDDSVDITEAADGSCDLSVKLDCEAEDQHQEVPVVITLNDTNETTPQSIQDNSFQLVLAKDACADLNFMVDFVRTDGDPIARTDVKFGLFDGGALIHTWIQPFPLGTGTSTYNGHQQTNLHGQNLRLTTNLTAGTHNLDIRVIHQLENDPFSNPVLEYTSTYREFTAHWNTI